VVSIFSLITCLKNILTFVVNKPSFYFDILYPFQNRVLQIIRHVDTGFYLTGGTAASRGYLNHRFSDDLDFFVNDDDNFSLWVDRIIQSINHQAGWQCIVLLKEDRFARVNLIEDNVLLKLEWVNDVPARAGVPKEHPILGWLDTPENILANKVTALLDREEPKDFADIWGFCCKMKLSLPDALKNADSKAAGVFPADLARLLCTVTEADWEAVRWINLPSKDEYLTQLIALGENLILS
jgi:hypothetical protein